MMTFTDKNTIVIIHHILIILIRWFDLFFFSDELVDMTVDIVLVSQ